MTLRNVSLPVEVHAVFSEELSIDDVTLHPPAEGQILTKLTASLDAPTHEEARNAAVVKITPILNALAFYLDAPVREAGGMRIDRAQFEKKEGETISMLFFETMHAAEEILAIRSLSQADLPKIGDISGDIAKRKDKAMRLMDQFRAGLSEKEPFVRFLSLWNVIEAASKPPPSPSKSPPKYVVEHLRRGRIWFDAEDLVRWYNLRNSIAHGEERYNTERAKAVSEELPAIRSLAREVVKDFLL